MEVHALLRRLLFGAPRPPRSKVLAMGGMPCEGCGRKPIMVRSSGPNSLVQYQIPMTGVWTSEAHESVTHYYCSADCRNTVTGGNHIDEQFRVVLS